MIFNSLHFLLFFPIVTLIYWVIPQKTKWVWLLVASYYFYMCWNASYALLIATSTLITYLSGILIHHTRGISDEHKRIRRKKTWVAISFLSNLVILFFYKYFGFALQNINAVLDVFHMTLLTPEFDVLLPVGISFYTFQALSYTVDVYRSDIEAEKNIGRYALFVSFFPQLVAGPIERSKNLLLQVNEKHYFSYTNMKNGLLLMLWGFFQKLIIADRVAILVNQVYNNYTEYAGLQIAIATVLFAVQIYCDFGGYSDIAIGASQVMGFKLMDNFKRPYFSKSIAEFWRRWHISLSTWFKDYLYIPLGGNRCSKMRKYFNLMVTFLVSGLWHGPSWNYIIWGGLHGVYQILGDLFKPIKQLFIKILNIDVNSFSHKLFRIIVTFALVDFAWIFFRAPRAKVALGVIKQMFSVFNPWIFTDGTLYTLGLDQKDFTVMIVAIGVLLAVSLFRRNRSIRAELSKQNIVFRWVVYFTVIFIVLVFGIYGPNFDASQFIYFQF